MDPSGSRVAVRIARLSDAPTLERIETASFSGDRLSPRSISRHLQSPTADVVIASVGGVDAGYAMILYRKGSTVARLYSIATLASSRGQGVGDALMKSCEQAAQKRGCDVFRLEVREDNPAAIRLYERLGFVRFGKRNDYYDDGATALRFEKPLKATARARPDAGAARMKRAL